VKEEIVDVKLDKVPVVPVFGNVKWLLLHERV
jgi:hypothetical protein